ncbi:glycoside hydrolase family 38 C-terminal domain-containing protein, partial [Bacteroidota bacterium]
MTKNLLLGLSLLVSTVAISQTNAAWPGGYYQGYTTSIKGGGFSYHSPQPDVTTSLLIRANDSSQYIAWETEAIPLDVKETSVRFIWMFGIDANPESYQWKLYVNNRYLLTFTNPTISEKNNWVVTGKSGSSLDFRTTLLDKYNDPMGYAILTVPTNFLKPGVPQVIKIVGESAGKQTWYMTFEAAVEESASVIQEEAVIRRDGRDFQSVLIQVVHLGEQVSSEIRIDNEIRKKWLIEPGFNSVRILIPDTTIELSHSAEIRMGKREPTSILFKTKPVRHWTIYLVQHTHTDIGYTRPQTEILPEHLRYIDYALDFCDQTDNYPEDARFRWTCETTWPVREYLKTRPEAQIERLRKRVQEGRIEIAGLFLNSSDLADEASVASSLQPIRLIREHGMPVKAAMQNDINGVPWCLVDYLSGAGVEYLNMAENTHRAHKPFDKPTTFWWESQAGNRILVNRPEHYMTANMLGILTSEETFAKNLFKHLHDIANKGYTFKDYPIQFSGYLTDNAPPSTTACDLVQGWNETYVWPKLKLATISDFMDVMKNDHAEDLPVYRGAWPDWWMDGFGSAPIETAYARMTHSDNIANKALQAFSVILGVEANPHITELQSQVDDAIAFYDEHTFGAAESIREPLAENSIVQKGEKLSNVWEAVKKNRILREEVMGRVQHFFPKADVPVITVFNPLNWHRSGVVTIYIDHEILPRDRGVRIVMEDNLPLPIQPISSREDGTYWAIYVKDIPPMGFRTLRLMTVKGLPIREQAESFTGPLENDFYRIEIDPATGRISSVTDKELNLELIDPAAQYSFAELITESLGTNRAQLEHNKLEEYTRATWANVTIGPLTEGPVWTSLTLVGKAPGTAAGDISCEIRLYKEEKKIELAFAMKKLAVTDPEAVYISFPFQLPESHFVVEVAGGTVVPGKDQLEGSSSDWIGIQNFVSVRNDSAQILFVSPEIPLVQLGDINLGNFSRIAAPATSHLFSWVFNNYWTTNFLASEEGELKWSYQLTSSSDPSNLNASKFGWGNRIPFLTRIFPAQTPDTVMIPRSFIGVGLRNVLLVCAYPSHEDEGVILQLRETDGKSTRFPVHDYLVSIVDLVSATRAVKVMEVNVLEEEIAEIPLDRTNPGRESWLG